LQRDGKGDHYVAEEQGDLDTSHREGEKDDPPNGLELPVSEAELMEGDEPYNHRKQTVYSVSVIPGLLPGASPYAADDTSEHQEEG